MAELVVGTIAESAPGEKRVAITPDGVTRLARAGFRITVQRGAGAAASFPDEAYAQAGAQLADRREVFREADIVAVFHPAEADLDQFRPGQVLIGLLAPLTDPVLAARLAAAQVTAVSLDGLPRTLSRAQSMDALSSQANIAGYKAALLAAAAYDGLFPMFMTAAGTTRPAQVLVMGAGVAGLQAIATARRLGALVTGYDVREAAKADVLSTGASFLALDTDVSASGEGGYARQLNEQEGKRQQDALNAAVAKYDVVITTAQVPGRRPPLLLTSAGLAGMQPGSVVVDLAASDLGGNAEGSVPDQTVVTPNGVRLIGAGNAASSVPKAASTAYSRNIAALLGHLVQNGELQLDSGDEITAGVLITHRGEVVNPLVHALLDSSHRTGEVAAT